MTAARRRWLAAAGIGAVAAGAGVAGYMLQRRVATKPPTDDFWSLAFDTPAQSPPSRLAMATLKGRPLLLNFWATWCPPCVREMPLLDRFYREQSARGWQVLGLAADNAAAVREFLGRTPVAFPIVLAGFEGVDLSRRLGNKSGGLPFTVLFGRDGRIVQRHTGETSHEQLTGWALTGS